MKKPLWLRRPRIEPGRKHLLLPARSVRQQEGVAVLPNLEREAVLVLKAVVDRYLHFEGVTAGVEVSPEDTGIRGQAEAGDLRTGPPLCFADVLLESSRTWCAAPDSRGPDSGAEVRPRAGEGMLIHPLQRVLS